jgi:spore maturation protein SpmA
MGGAVLNWIWLGLILLAVVYGAFTGHMQDVSKASFDGAKQAVELVINLTGVMILMLGLMRVAMDGGLLRAIARAIAPLMRRLFPDVPPEHPAMGALVMNFATNILGMGNAATPFGLKAMRELESLNRTPGVATDAMVLFLAINATAITLFPPTGTIAVRAAAGSLAPWSIWVPTLIATTCSTGTAIVVFYLLRRLPRYAPPRFRAAAAVRSRSGARPVRQARSPARPGARALIMRSRWRCSRARTDVRSAGGGIAKQR